jgi:hypothetical protein
VANSGTRTNRLSNPELERRSLALAAAHQAVEASTELLRFAREGNAVELSNGASHAFDIEVIEKLLDATKLAMEIDGKTDDSIYADICDEIEGWMG